MIVKRFAIGLILLICLSSLSSCAPNGYESSEAGFISGIWHGFIIIFSLIGKLFEGEDTGAKQETYVENKNEKIPFVKNPFEASQEQPNQFMQSFQSPENQDFQSQSMFQVPEMAQPNEANNLFSMEKESSSPEGFGDVKTGIEDLNKNSSVNSKIAVDQLREIKELNKKMEQLVAQLASSRAMVVNNVRNSSVNSFLQPSTINSFRSSFRE